MTRNKWKFVVRLLCKSALGLFLAFLMLSAEGGRAAAPGEEADEPWLRPYTGPTRTDVDATTLDGKVLCGYQGWFNTPGDGTDFGFGHWGQSLERQDRGRFTVDMWPDVSDYAPEDLCEVPGLKMPDGSPARLYSGFRKGPTLVHCNWMREYGIDGVFLSRFVSETTSPARARHVNTVLANVREGCHRDGRVWAMMLDLSTGRNGTTATVMNDWKFLCDKVKIREDSRYLHHQKKPVVLLWGLGFKDRPWTPEQAEELINFFKNDRQYGGVYLIGGIDPHWRTLRGESRTDPGWAKVYRMFDAISPWDAGRYRDDTSMDRVRKEVWEGDLAELKDPKIGYMPTAFPGFSWDNLRRTKPGTTMIARRKGDFYWRQFAIFKTLGIRSVFVGMFDEVNEGTAIYKVANRTPEGKYFATYEGLPSDWYLKLTGAATQMIRGETPLSETIPKELPFPVRDAGQYVKVEYLPATAADELQIGVTYTLWIPDGAVRLRGIIVHQHGAGTTASKEGATAAYDLHWQALAKKWYCAILGPSYHVLNEKTDVSAGASGLWFDPRRGSEKTFLKALGELASKSGHSELETVPWVLWGHSGGGIWSDVMTTLHPDRVVAVWLRSGSAAMFRTHPEFPQPKVPAAVYAIPIMCNPGVKEEAAFPPNEKGKEKGPWFGNLATFNEYRAKGGLIGFAPDPRTGHECGDSRYLAIPFLDACLGVRLPDKGAKDQTLKPMDTSKAWLAPLMGKEAQPAAEFKGKAEEAVWLPNEQVARAWMDYVKTGAVGDTTPPPAPFNVKVSAEGDQGTEIVWSAEADFESGIGGFIVLRDGEELAKVPQKPVGKFGRPLFQAMTYHDTPAKPLPEMRYVDASAKAGEKHTYAVIAVNSVGLKSKPSADAPRQKEPPAKTGTGKYDFDKTMSREVLDNYLSRSITMEGLLNGRGDLDDNIRMLKSTGVKFVGRSLCLWGGEAQLLRNLERAKQDLPKVHKADPDMILQACVFEIVSTQVEQVPVPEWAFVALGQPVEKRNFRYADMIYPEGQRRDWGRNASVPDVSRPETKLWFYYLAASYIDLGFEAIHFGQVEIMNRNDHDLTHWEQVLTLVRSYAAKHARRYMVLCDGHVPSGGLVREGRLLLDFHSFPLRVMEVPDKPEEAILKVGFSDGIYGRSKGGLTFSGWKCEHLPYLVELDNWGVSRQPGQAKAGGIWVWGYDEISWFAHQSKEYRADWLRYAWDWVRRTDPNGHLQMPGSRTVRSPLDNRRWYYANVPSKAVPDGLGDEEAIRAIWAAENAKGLKAAEPSPTFAGEKTAWHGFDRYDFLMDKENLTVKPFKAANDEGNGIKSQVEGQWRCVVVVPKEAAAGNPWSWRGCYFDHEPQAEVELLKRGFHIGFIMSDPGKSWDAWYTFLTEKHGLSKKPAFIGMSRGGYNAFTWATANPDKVSCIYADNPAISRDSLMKLGELVKNDVPLLHVCGSLDPILGNNTLVIENIYQQLGGRISVMIKEGVAHHPHSLRDPGPIADFIVQSLQPTRGDPPAFAGTKFARYAFYGVENSYRDFPKEKTHITCRGPWFTECYDRYEFRLDGIKGAVTVIVPKTAAPGNPWVFRADFVNRDAVVDLALLAKGFHIVVGPVPTDTNGPAVQQWNAVYKYLTDHGFSKKAVMEGAGGAAGEAYAWAIENPDKVCCIYGENPVLRSNMSKTQPLDNLAPLAKAGVPILHVCGSLDPWLNDHTRVAEKRYKELAGQITVIVKEGEGHYPLAPTDRKPVVDFITKSVK